MGRKDIVRIDSYGDKLPSDMWDVHCGSDADGEGYICGLKRDEFHDVHGNIRKVEGFECYEATDKPVTCSQCISYLESASGYKRNKKGEWL